LLRFLVAGASVKVLRCPVCGQTIDPQSTTVRPFCSQRCQLIDLKRWLGEEYGLPIPDRDTEPVEPGSDEEDRG
jgi:endogenous inhibitor of DNA gyrase (YacG/DUF329 family)